MIFLSYCWKNEKIADSIDSYCSDNQIILIRDKRDLKYKQSIKDFMSSIRDADFVIMIISKDYLKSKNCMFEMSEFVKNKDFKNKIIPVITKESKIFDAKSKINYLKFWTDKKNNLKADLKNFSPEKSIPLFQEVKEYDNIESNIIEFLSVVSDMNNIVISKNLFNDTHFDTIRNYLNLTNISSKILIINIVLNKELESSTSDILSFLNEIFTDLKIIHIKENKLSIKINSYLKKEDLIKRLSDKFSIEIFHKLNIIPYNDAYYFIAKRKIDEYSSKAIMWWKPMDNGYTDNLKDAGYYNINDIKRFTKKWFDEDQIAVKCSIVDKLETSVIPINSSYSRLLIENKESYIGNIYYEEYLYF